MVGALALVRGLELMFAAPLKLLIALIGVFWLAIVGAWAMYQWDRRPAHWPVVHVLFLSWSPPDSLGARLAASAVDLNQCHANTSTLEAAISRQNASLTALSAAGVRATAQVEGAVHASQGPMVAATKAQASISAPVVGDDVCARAKVVDQRFKASLLP